MRINGIHAENFLSFGESGFSLHGISQQRDAGKQGEASLVTILVGPNGSGKSNVVRMVQQLLNACHDKTTDQTIRSLYHRPNGQQKTVKISMDIAFNATEQEILNQWWGLGLGYGDELKGIDMLSDASNPNPRGNNAIKKQHEKYAQWIRENLSGISVPFLAKGILILELYNPAQISQYTPSKQFYLQLSEGLSLDLLQSTLYFHEPPEFDGQSNGSLTRTMAASLPDEIRHSLAEFLDSDSAFLPQLPIEHYRVLPDNVQKVSANISHNLIRNSSDATVAEKWVQLQKRFGKQNSNSDLTLADVIKSLVTESIVCIDNWSVQTRNALGLLTDHSLLELLTSGFLAAYILALKNGSSQQLKQFSDIQSEYHQLTGDTIDVKLIIPDQSGRITSLPPKVMQIATDPDSAKWVIQPAYQDNIGLEVELMSDNDLPLEYSGSGKQQLLLWLSLTHLHQDKVILMDEPDAHLHPTLATKLSSKMVKQNSQYIVVSHSPYIIPSGHLEWVRRISMSEGASRVSQPLSVELIKDVLLRKRGLEPDDRLFLYARAVVFVEGPNDAEVLRVWINKWAQVNKISVDLLHERGIAIWPCEGKNQVAQLMALATAFDVPNIGVWDADVLSDKTAKHHDSFNNVTVLTAWKKYHLVTDDLAARLKLGNTELLKEFPSHRVFLIGQKLTDNLESLFRDCWGGDWPADLRSEGYYGPTTYRKWVEENEWPESWENAFLFPLFNAINNLAPSNKEICNMNDVNETTHVR